MPTSNAGCRASSEQPVLASCYAALAGDVQLLGAVPGQKTAKLIQPVRRLPSPSEPLAEVGGVNVHAKVAFDGRDRSRLERLCRYLARCGGRPFGRDARWIETFSSVIERTWSAEDGAPVQPTRESRRESCRASRR